jgi:hypothetical protein
MKMLAILSRTLNSVFILPTLNNLKVFLMSSVYFIYSLFD